MKLQVTQLKPYLVVENALCDHLPLTIPYNMDMTLNQLKDIIEKKINYPREIYFLKYNGHPMYENKKLDEYQVQKDGTIEISIRIWYIA